MRTDATTFRKRPLLRIRTASCLVAVLASGCFRDGESARHVPVPAEFTLVTADGYRLPAICYPAPCENPPALIMVHGRGENRGAWAPLALAAQRAGYLCVAFNMRGHDGSEAPPNAGPGKSRYTEFTREDWLGVRLDIAVAKKAALEAGAEPNNLVLAGAGLGANLALVYASADPDFQAVILLSPGLEYQGIKILDLMRNYNKRPVLILVAQGDAYAAGSAAQLKAAGQGFCELREYEGTAHGTGILATTPHAISQVLLWLDEIVGPEATRHSKQQSAP